MDPVVWWICVQKGFCMFINAFLDSMVGICALQPGGVIVFPVKHSVCAGSWYDSDGRVS